MFEELKIYLDLVEELGDPFTIFERDWPVEPEPAPARHVLNEAPASEFGSESWFGGQYHLVDPSEALSRFYRLMEHINEATATLKTVKTPANAAVLLESLEAALGNASEQAGDLREWTKRGGFWPVSEGSDV